MEIIKSFIMMYFIGVAIMYFIYFKRGGRPFAFPGDLLKMKAGRTLYFPISSALTIAIVVALFLSVFGTVCAEEPVKININTATAEQLVELQRIGPSYAAKIIAYRDANGPFKSVEEIMNVKGIGQKTYEVNKDRITVE